MGFGACPLRGNLNRLKGRAEDNLEKKEIRLDEQKKAYLAS